MRLNQNVIHNLKFRRILNSPNSALIMKFRKKNKKGMGVSTSRPSLLSGLRIASTQG